MSNITQELCNAFKLKALGFLLTDTIKIALYSSAAVLGKGTTVYTTTGEVTGSGYAAGGKTLSGAAISLDGDVAIADFTDPSWASSTITARAALIYDASDGNKALEVINFGSDQTSNNSTLTIILPAAIAASAIIRIA